MQGDQLLHFYKDSYKDWYLADDVSERTAMRTRATDSITPISAPHSLFIFVNGFDALPLMPTTKNRTVAFEKDLLAHDCSQSVYSHRREEQMLQACCIARRLSKPSA